MAYYRRIRDMREDHDLTQRQLAALLHMPQPQYNRYEQGLRDLPTTTLIALADNLPHLDRLSSGPYERPQAACLPITHQKGPPLQEAPFAYHGPVRMGDAARFLVFSGKCAQIL